MSYSHTPYDQNLDDYENYLLDCVRTLQEQCRKDCEPYVKRLVELNNLRPPPPILVTMGQLAAMGIRAVDGPSQPDNQTTT